MVRGLGELELRCLDAMSRPQLIEAVRARQDGLPADLREPPEGQPTDRLRLLLLAARLLGALRQVRGADWARQAPHW